MRIPATNMEMRALSFAWSEMLEFKPFFALISTVGQRRSAISNSGNVSVQNGLSKYQSGEIVSPALWTSAKRVTAITKIPNTPSNAPVKEVSAS